MLHASCDTCQSNSLFVGVLPGIQQSLGKLGNQDQLAGYGRTLPKRHHCARRAGRAGLLITHFATCPVAQQTYFGRCDCVRRGLMQRLRAAASPVAILLACLVQHGASALSSQHELPVELQGLKSSYNCAPLEAGQHPDHRVCFFKNLLVFNGSLVYLGPDARSIPTINTEYWLGGELQDWLTNFTSIELLEPRPQHVVTVNKAALTDWPFYHNYFHVFAEYLPSLHNVLCKYWNDCTFDPNTDLDIMLLTPRIHANHSRDAVRTDAARCMTAKPISAISTTVNNTHTAVLIKDAITGWGPECRADHWHCLPW